MKKIIFYTLASCVLLIGLSGAANAGCEGLYSCRSHGILSQDVRVYQQNTKNYATVTTDACVYSYGVCRKDIYPFVQYTWKGTGAVNFSPVQSPRLDMRNAQLLSGDTRCAQYANAYYPNPQVYRYTYTFEFTNSGSFPLYIYTLDLIPNQNCKDDLGRFDDTTATMSVVASVPATPTPTPNLNVSCSASPSSIQAGNSTTFTSNVSGGTGAYNYSWSGSCNGSNSNCSNSFSNQGTYTSTVTVTSGSQTASANCSVNIQNNNYNNNAYISCYNNDLYWFDQNGNRQSLYQSCTNSNNNNYNSGATYCVGNSVYRQTNYSVGGCAGNACYNTGNNNSAQLVQTCGYNQSCQNGSCVNINICECSSGLCCDGCHYKSSYSICNTDSQAEYGCPWGSVAGSDVGFRTKTRSQYCSGYSASCNGIFSAWTGLSNWTVGAYCNVNQTCLSGYQTCQPIYVPAATPSYFNHYWKGCYNSNLYWYDSLNVRQDQYRSCNDNNDCTLDSCSSGKCNNTLKCDGTTCTNGSVNYCSSCNTCGDGVCNCGETLSSCQKDCMGIIGLAVNILGKTDIGSTQWTKTFAATADQEVDFLIVISNGQDTTMDNVVVKTDLPSEIIYDNGLTLDGISFNGDIRTGINLGSLSPKASRAISFKGRTAGNISRTEADTIATVSTSAGSSIDNVKTTFSSPAPTSQAVINPQSGLAAFLGINLSKSLYLLLWIIVIIFALFLISKIIQGFVRKRE